jgi:hypothetical protein
LLAAFRAGAAPLVSILLLRNNKLPPSTLEKLEVCMDSNGLRYLTVLDLRENELGDEGATVAYYRLFDCVA